MLRARLLMLIRESKQRGKFYFISLVDASSGVTKDVNNIVSAWESKTNSGTSLSLSSDGQVQYKNGSFYSSRSPAIYFDGNSYLKNDLFNFFALKDEFTQIIVGMVERGSDGVIYHDAQTGFFGNATSGDLKFQESADGETLFVSGVGDDIRSSRYFILSKVFSKNNDQTSNIEIRLNGRSLNFNISENLITPFAGVNGFTLGSSYSGSNKIKLHLAELFLSDGRLSDESLTELENKLYKKYIGPFECRPPEEQVGYDLSGCQLPSNSNMMEASNCSVSCDTGFIADERITPHAKCLASGENFKFFGCLEVLPEDVGEGDSSDGVSTPRYRVAHFEANFGVTVTDNKVSSWLSRPDIFGNTINLTSGNGPS